MKNPSREIYESVDSLAEAAAGLLLKRLEQHSEKRPFFLALSGGSTPALMYRRLAEQPDAAELLGKSEIFFSDERAVPPDHPDSNYGLAHRELFAPLKLGETNVHRFEGEKPVESEAARMEQVISKLVPEGPDGVPAFDLILLGMGSDGHTASLFPNEAWVSDETALCVGYYVKKLKANRLSFTLRLINAAKEVRILVTGKEKASMIRLVLESGPDTILPPVGCVYADRVVWMLDQAAANLLTPVLSSGSIR